MPNALFLSSIESKPSIRADSRSQTLVLKSCAKIVTKTFYFWLSIAVLMHCRTGWRLAVPIWTQNIINRFVRCHWRAEHRLVLLGYVRIGCSPLNAIVMTVMRQILLQSKAVPSLIKNVSTGYVPSEANTGETGHRCAVTLWPIRC